MALVLSLLAQLVHSALVLVAAPLLVGFQAYVEARLSGRRGDAPWQEWRELIRLARKQTTVPDGTSTVSRLTPLVLLSTTAVAAILVPSFALGMAFASASDLLVVAGLLGAGRVMLALGALDAGTARAALDAAHSTSIGCYAEPALFIIILSLGLAGGTTNIDLLADAQRSGMLYPPIMSAFAAACFAILAWAAPAGGDFAAEFSGIDLALIRYADALRRLVWLNLIIALFLPIGFATAGSGPIEWLVGLIVWAMKLAVLASGLAASNVLIGRARMRQMQGWLGVASGLAFLSAVAALAAMVAA